MSNTPTHGEQMNAQPDSQGISGTVEGMTFRPDRRFWVVYICLMMVQFLTAMYHTVIATALPTVIGDLGGVAHMSWAITAYTLGQTLAMPINGKLGDLVGRKRLYLLAIALFVGGSALCGLATDMFAFTVFRFVQGLGGGGLMICSQAITGDIIPPRVRGTYMAPMGAMFGIAAILGPLLGGWLSDWLGWRWIFWFFLPFGLFAWVAVAIALRMPRRSSSFSVDWAGLALTSIGAAGIVLIATWGGTTYAWSSPAMLGLICVTVAAWAAVVPVERRAADPILPLQVLTDHTFIIATVVSVLMAACMFGMNGYLPTYLQMVHGVSATMSGLLLVPGSVGMFTGSLLSGTLVTRTGRYKPFPIVGSLVAATGMAMLGLLPADAPVAWTGVAVFVLEIGIGMFLQLSVLVIQNALPASMLGTATSTNNFFREIGVSIGNTVVGVLFTGRLTASLLSLGFDSREAASITPAIARSLNAATGAAVVDAYHHALAPVLLSLAPVLLVAAAVAGLFKPIPLSTKTGLEQLEEELAEDGPADAYHTDRTDG
ncbi:MDR family MFS transporter [Actinomyces glycerinitolerans]|uniref:Tetracycline resistance protein tetb signature n=1 Tax=Actinomyces glycerinitolerans TaxID=1892869 RepID=A0A1M4RVB1_9ACTO|nr:MDR family MFS transporter [Actinomyces glycerinitolerans]SHE23871.1 tetracycline resistance protein tetb signature [Actinomyces glycerinitolerans]